MRLLNGAYRVQKARILEEVPDLTEFIDCSYCYRFIDELSCVRQMLSVGVRTHGVWVGMMKNGEPTDMPKNTEAQSKTEQDPEHHYDETLEHIANMQTQLGGLQQGIIERDQIIERYEQPVMCVAEAVAQESKACSTDSMSSDTWIKKATTFAHKVHGMTMVMPETRGVRELSLLAHELTDNTPTP